MKHGSWWDQIYIMQFTTAGGEYGSHLKYRQADVLAISRVGLSGIETLGFYI